MAQVSSSDIKLFKTEISKLWKRSTSETNGRELVERIIHLLDEGDLSVANFRDGHWEVNEWVKKAILLYFRYRHSKTIEHGPFEYCDKIPLKKNFHEKDVRVVPSATIRYGSFIGEESIINPSFINIGVYIGKKTKIDTWANIGACTQIGKNVTIGSHVGIGSMLEPVQSSPCIIEDRAYISSRCEIAEGVIIGKGAVLAMGCYIGSSTKVYDAISETLVPRGQIPPWSICVPGSIPARDRTHSTYAIIIKGTRDSEIDAHRSLNEVIENEPIAY